MLATSPVNHLLCGTAYPGYLKGGNASLPTKLGQEVDATVCFHGTGRSEPCEETTAIHIKKCRNFFLYNLPNVHSCFFGYCGQ